MNNGVFKNGQIRIENDGMNRPAFSDVSRVRFPLEDYHDAFHYRTFRYGDFPYKLRFILSRPSGGGVLDTWKEENLCLKNEPMTKFKELFSEDEPAAMEYLKKRKSTDWRRWLGMGTVKSLLPIFVESEAGKEGMGRVVTINQSRNCKGDVYNILAQFVKWREHMPLQAVSTVMKLVSSDKFSYMTEINNELGVMFKLSNLIREAASDKDSGNARTSN